MDMFMIALGVSTILLSAGMVATNYVIMRNVQGVRRDMKGIVGKFLRRMADVMDEPASDRTRR